MKTFLDLLRKGWESKRLRVFIGTAIPLAFAKQWDALVAAAGLYIAGETVRPSVTAASAFSQTEDDNQGALPPANS